MNSNFQNLLEKSKQLTEHLGDTQDYLIERNVDQIDDTTRRLRSKAPGAGADIVAKNKAYYLLARKGFDPERLSRDLNAINVKSTFEPMEPLGDTDIDGYLRHQHDMIILTAIEEAKKESMEHFKHNYVCHLESDWDETKRELMESLGQRSLSWTGPTGSQYTDMQISAGGGGGGASGAMMSRGDFGTSLARGQSAMSRKMITFSRVVYQLNEEKRQGRRFPLLQMLKTATESLEYSTSSKAELKDSWQLLFDMVQVDGVGGLSDNSAYRAHYANNSAELRLRFVAGTKTFLERQFRGVMEQCVASNRRTAHLGGVPGLAHTVRAFLNVKYGDGPWPQELEDDGIWAIIYYCLRCGDANAALEVACANESIPNFVSYLRNFINNDDRRLPNNLLTQLINDYRLVRTSTDPYKQAVYNLIGRCDVHRTAYTDASNQNLINTTQDFLWFKLSMLQDGDQGAPQFFASDAYTLPQLQAMLLEFGPSHFNSSGNNPLLYFQVLLMSQQFERAVQYILGTEQYYVEGVHFAVALYYVGVLRQPTNGRLDALFIENALPQLCFERVLRQYVPLFASTDPLEALQYLVLLHDETRLSECVKDLVIDTGEFETLVGGIQSDGSRKVGCISKYVPEAQCQQIIELAASEAETNGNYDEAIKLYDLAEDYATVLRILNTQLSRVLTVRDSERERFAPLAASVYTRYRQHNILHQVTDPSEVLAFEQMLQLVSFFDLYYANRFAETLQAMEVLNVVPFDVNKVAESVDRFRSLHQCVLRNFAEALLATMTCLYKIYGQLKASAGGGREQLLEVYRLKARALIMFAGMIQFRMPGDSTAQLNRMAVFMN